MIVILGLIVLVGAVTVGMAGVISNGGSGHALTGLVQIRWQLLSRPEVRRWPG
jgi:hypothetical protein